MIISIGGDRWRASVYGQRCVRILCSVFGFFARKTQFWAQIADFVQIFRKLRTKIAQGPSPADSHSKRPPLHEAALLNTCFRAISVIQKRIDLGIYYCDCEIVEKDRELAVFVAEGIACVKVSLGSQGVLDAERVANLQKRACIRLKC